MKIALVTLSCLPQIGGAEFVIHELAQQWSRQGHEVCVMNALTDEATHANGQYSVKRFRLLRGSTRLGYHRFIFRQYAVRNLSRLLDKVQPDFISAHFGYPTGTWLADIRPLPKFLVTCHGSELNKFDFGFRSKFNLDRTLALALNKSAGAIAISTHARKLMEELGVLPSKILDIPNGVDLERFQANVSVDARALLGVPPGALMILSVGREHPVKAYDAGLRAFARFTVRFPDAYYVILGKGTNRWAALAAELGVANRVVTCEGLHGDDLVASYQQADIFFSPSIWETMPLVVLEAMAAGCPQVVTNVSGSQDLVATGENGIVVEPGDIDAMAKALYELASSESQRTRLGSENLRRSQNYSWDKISRMYLEHA
jgi:glycosyltransferase involved in cell wall biosynthesis